MPPDISVVIPTYNRANRIGAVIESLLEQQPDGISFEVLVVDNGSTDWTPLLVELLALRDARVKYVHEPRPGASNARNAGIARAAGSIVAFIDDDVLPSREWIGNLKRAFDANPDVDCLGGRVEPLWPRRLPGWLTPRHYSPLALQMNRCREFDAGHASACLITANFACRRQVFADVGGFSPDFSRDEDREFNLRLWSAGKRGLYSDDVRVVAAIDPARLTKRYHRRWHQTTGTNHARLRYREIIDRDGRLVAPFHRRTVFGCPAYIYRECLTEMAQWVRSAARARFSDAFYHECRVRYFLSYIARRARLAPGERP